MVEIPTADRTWTNAAGRFERAWSAGHRRGIEAHLAEAERRPVPLKVLLRVEGELRHREGERPGPEV
jgi:hypothetical protein